MKKWLNINPKSIKYVQAVFVFQINHYKYMYNTIHIHPTFFLLCTRKKRLEQRKVIVIATLLMRILIHFSFDLYFLILIYVFVNVH